MLHGLEAHVQHETTRHDDDGNSRWELPWKLDAHFDEIEHTLQVAMTQLALKSEMTQCTPRLELEGRQVLTQCLPRQVQEQRKLQVLAQCIPRQKLRVLAQLYSTTGTAGAGAMYSTSGTAGAGAMYTTTGAGTAYTAGAGAMYFHSLFPDESSLRSDSDEKRKKRSQRSAMVDTKQLVLWQS